MKPHICTHYHPWDTKGAEVEAKVYPEGAKIRIASNDSEACREVCIHLSIEQAREIGRAFFGTNATVPAEAVEA